jgi:hypothetical protein
MQVADFLAHADAGEMRMLDLENPQVGVEVLVRYDGKVLWVNVDGRCVLRICQIAFPVDMIDERQVREG